jgi:polysaccharide export outer membrane protein
MKKLGLLLLLSAVLLTACKTPQDIAYLQDVSPNVPIQTHGDGNIRFLPGDKLSIYVHSRDPQLMNLFNLYQGVNNFSTNNGGMYAYTVDTNGNIDFPVLGAVQVQGLTRTEVAQTIKQRLVSQNLCKDPTITVTFYDMKFSVLGNAGAGVKEITKDKITLLEAIAMASDLQIDGLRKNVLVMRQEGDQQVPYRVDLTSAESIYNSPVYYIRQNDVIYVEPNDKFKRNSTVMTNDAYRPTFWMSVASFLTTIALIFIK